MDKGGGWCAVEEKLDTQRYETSRGEERKREEKRGEGSAQRLQRSAHATPRARARVFLQNNASEHSEPVAERASTVRHEFTLS